MNLNSVILVGRLVRAPELKTIPSGQSVCNFSIATSRSWKDAAGTKQDKVEFHNCVAWGKTAELIAQYFVKGQLMGVHGRLENRTWEKQDGSKGYATDVVIEKFEFGAKPAGNAAPQNEGAEYPPRASQTSEPYPGEPEIKMEDIPF